MKIYCMLLVCFLWECLLMNIVLSEEPKLYYTAALLEHNLKGNSKKDSPRQIINKNLNYFESATKIAHSKGADIIVFPEYGVFSLLSRKKMKNILEKIPDPSQVKKNPCNQKEEFADRPMLYRISCIAKTYNIVVVANIGDIQPCTKKVDPNCPSDNAYHYNGNVAFNRDGTILAKYHKEHLYFENGMDFPRVPQNPVFVTDFGTFAMYVCFDSLFKHIAEDAGKKDIDNILLPTKWYDAMPFLTSTQYFQSWALGNNVTFLTSNGQIPTIGTIGSGIFHGKMGAIIYTFNPDGLSKLLVANVPRSKRQILPSSLLNASITIITENGSKPYDMNNDGNDIPETCDGNSRGATKNIQQHYRCQVPFEANYTFAKLVKSKDTLKVCNNGLCCSLEYEAYNLNETYYFTVYNGTFNLRNSILFAQENCFLTRCNSVNGKVCNSFPLRSQTAFHFIKLSGNFSTKYVYPSVVTSELRLAPMSDWTYSTKGEGTYNSFLKYDSRSKQGLLTAGLNGRCYDRDIYVSYP